jgi:hypothetical protein
MIEKVGDDAVSSTTSEGVWYNIIKKNLWINP